LIDRSVAAALLAMAAPKNSRLRISIPLRVLNGATVSGARSDGKLCLFPADGCAAPQ